MLGCCRAGPATDLNEDDFKMIHGPVDDMEFPLGAALFQEGDSARGIFTLRSGMLKLVRSTAPDPAGAVATLAPKIDGKVVTRAQGSR